jgi:hypothetical protein
MTAEHGRHAHHGGHHGHGHGHTYDVSSLRRADAFYGATYQKMVGWLDVRPGSRVLEAGSGAGGVTELLAGAVGPPGEVCALDVTPTLHLETLPGLFDPAMNCDKVSDC